MTFVLLQSTTLCSVRKIIVFIEQNKVATIKWHLEGFNEESTGKIYVKFYWRNVAESFALT